ncbi:hypothetical protein L1080_019880 [Rhodococcus sp. MSC1_016]|uniref:hypothetical protein n=1 Tax=Rhodococcus sp. MSC1_016 TaxID=2909266 RepID=UPI00202EF12E|nr:hypothetical protein [Rhodococcus sp. MSC1_016]
MAERKASVFEVEHEIDADTIRKAQRAVASRSRDAHDCKDLLSILGILHITPAPSDTAARAGAENVSVSGDRVRPWHSNSA